MATPVTVPTHLLHKPIIAANNYAKIDEDFYKHPTDAVALSVGFAQFDEDDISAKVWRYIKEVEKWSRQSEELPVHRVFDLAILSIASFMIADDKDYNKTCLNEEVVNDEESLKALKKYSQTNQEHLNKKLTSLQSILTKYLKTNQ